MSAIGKYVGALVLVHVAWLLFYLVGTLVLRPARTSRTPGGAAADLAVTTACGMALVGFATFALGLAHLLYPFTPVGMAVVAALIFAYRGDAPWRAAFWTSRFDAWRAAASPGAFAIYAFALVYGFASARPDLGGDTTSYHLVYAAEWARAHALIVDPTLRVPYYATNWLLVDTWFMMFGLTDQTQTLSWLTSVLSLLGIYGFVIASVERDGRPAGTFALVLGVIAAASVALSTVFLETSATALIDVPIGLFFLATVIALTHALRARSGEQLAACIVCAAFLVGMKSSLLAFYLPFAFAVVAAAIRLGAAPRRIAVALVAFTVLAAPWYVKNFIEAGDPISPALNIPLQGVDPHWSADDFHGLSYDLKLGEDPSPLGNLLVPLKSLTEPSSPAFRADGGTFIVLLAWVPAFVAALALYRRQRPHARDDALVACLIAFAVGYWMSTSYQSRYMLIFLAALAAFLGMLAARAAVRYPNARWWAAAALAFCAIPSTQNQAAARNMLAAFDDFQANYHDRESWMMNRAPTYPEVQSISDALQRSGRTDLRVYRAYLEFDRLYFTQRGVRVAGDLFGPERYLDFQQAIVEDSIASYVQRYHIGAFLFPTQWEGNFPRAEQAALAVELGALGFHRAAVSDRFDVYLARDVR